MLGAGFVTRPTLDILSDAGIQVTVGKIPLSVVHLVYSPPMLTCDVEQPAEPRPALRSFPKVSRTHTPSPSM